VEDKMEKGKLYKISSVTFIITVLGAFAVALSFFTDFAIIGRFARSHWISTMPPPMGWSLVHVQPIIDIYNDLMSYNGLLFGLTIGFAILAALCLIFKVAFKPVKKKWFYITMIIYTAAFIAVIGLLFVLLLPLLSRYNAMEMHWVADGIDVGGTRWVGKPTNMWMYIALVWYVITILAGAFYIFVLCKTYPSSKPKKEVQLNAQTV
jgi:hypothetical protein